MPDLKLSDTQLMLLSQAAQREDLLLVIPDTLKGGAVKAVISKLMTHALVDEIAVTSGEPAWRKDNERPIGLKLTHAGLDAIGVEPDEEARPESVPSSVSALVPPRRARDGSKQALVLSQLEREDGATLDDLVQATGWLPHTTRAALTRLRQGGTTLVKTRGEDGKTRYRIAPLVSSPIGAPDEQRV